MTSSKSQDSPSPPVGLWLIGGRGGVAACSIFGMLLLRRNAVPPVGLVTAQSAFHKAGLIPFDRVLIGGHEIRAARLVDEIRAFHRTNRVFLPDWIDLLEAELDDCDARIRWGTLSGASSAIRGLAAPDVPRDASPWEAVRRLQQDLAAFQQEHGLRHVVVVNVASTEPPADSAAFPTSWEELEKALAGGELSPPPSTLYAVAALSEGCSYINFTPSLGASLPALTELAEIRRTRHMGCDGKTGETLMKSVLAPMYRARNLQVLSWVGHNIFGNLDGRILDDPQHKATKVRSKDHLVGDILGYAPKTVVSIEYVEDMGDWKTAWDHIHFSGFLGTPMVLQFIWQGCDSLLAAPLVLDLFRLTERADRAGISGTMPFLAPFFKSPYGVSDNDFFSQHGALLDWVASLSKDA
ncbi:MAG: myo-inositol-1-phosphate synthase [Thermogutta sp.]|nr:myo-inositol-1-phosphate synthase [Thermogutta sp.]